MKRVCVCLILCCLLIGCGQNIGLEKSLMLREEISKGKGFRFQCTITADYVDSFRTFQLDCTVNSDGDVMFTVISPDSISGISGIVDGHEGKLTFDSHILSFPLLADGLLSPVSMPWIVIEALRGGYIRSSAEEDPLIKVTFDDTFSGQTLQVAAWIQGDLKLDHCEIIWEGRRILSMTVESFVWL